MNLYAHEKIRELESELKYRLHFEPPLPRRRPVVGGLAAGAGRILRRVGEGLESWSSPGQRESEVSFTRRAIH